MCISEIWNEIKIHIKSTFGISIIYAVISLKRPKRVVYHLSHWFAFLHLVIINYCKVKSNLDLDYFGSTFNRFNCFFLSYIIFWISWIFRNTFRIRKHSGNQFEMRKKVYILGQVIILNIILSCKKVDFGWLREIWSKSISPVSRDGTFQWVILLDDGWYSKKYRLRRIYARTVNHSFWLASFIEYEIQTILLYYSLDLECFETKLNIVYI